MFTNQKIRWTASCAAWGLILLIGCERQPPPPPTPTTSTAAPPVVTASGSNQAAPEAPVAAGEASDGETVPAEAATAPAPRVIAYYFHRTLRCPTCLAIEQRVREALEVGYADALADGRLQWRPVNIETPGQEHFQQDFALETSTLVLVQHDGPRQVRWKKLEQVWQLLEDPTKFQNYIWTEMEPYLGE